MNLNSKFGPALAAEVGLPRPIGAQVTGVTPNSPAEAAKLQPGDVILEFNGTPIEDDAHLVNFVSLTEVGKTVPLLIFRDRKPMTIMVEVADRGQVWTVSSSPANLPSPVGRGAGGEGGVSRTTEFALFAPHNPHPSPLPKGEGTLPPILDAQRQSV